jgi:predicted transcriptional regulator
MAKKIETQEIPEAKIRQAIWYLKTGKTKKFVCEHLGIAYNTTRLTKIIEDFKAKEVREKELKEKAKNTALTEATKKDIVNSYLNGEAQSAIATRYYISPQRVKTVLLESNVPIRARAKNAPAKTEHIVQDLDVKFKLRDKVFYGSENSFATITEVFDEEYADKLRQGRQRWIELLPWKEGGKHPEPVVDIHYQIYWELEDGSTWKLDALKRHIKRVEQLIADTGRETYEVWIESDHAFRKIFVPRADLFPVVSK